MQSGKIITGLAIGTIAALLIIPKTRKMIYNGICDISNSLKGIADNAIDVAEKGSRELDKLSDKAHDVASSIKETKHAWQ